jgi:hypothetical protein
MRILNVKEKWKRENVNENNFKGFSVEKILLNPIFRGSYFRGRS